MCVCVLNTLCLIPLFVEMNARVTGQFLCNIVNTVNTEMHSTAAFLMSGMYNCSKFKLLLGLVWISVSALWSCHHSCKSIFLLISSFLPFPVGFWYVLCPLLFTLRHTCRSLAWRLKRSHQSVSNKSIHCPVCPLYMMVNHYHHGYFHK